METLQEKRILHRDEIAEQKFKDEIAAQKLNIEQAVYLFGELDLKPLQSGELNYFLQGGEEWILQRWKAEQSIPKGFPKATNFEKYLSILDRPDWSAVVQATSKCNVLRQGLFRMEEGKILIDKDAAEAYITQGNVYLDDGEEVPHDKMMLLRELLFEFGFLNRSDRRVLPIDLSITGMSWQPYFEGIESYPFEPRTLKKFLQSHKL